MNAKKREPLAVNSSERPPAGALVMLAWFPAPGIAAMQLALMAAGVHDPIAAAGIGPELRQVVWGHLVVQMLIGVGTSTAILRHLHAADFSSLADLNIVIRRDQLTGWCLQAGVGLSFAAYMLWQR